jgi:hypothetical protein
MPRAPTIVEEPEGLVYPPDFITADEEAEAVGFLGFTMREG